MKLCLATKNPGKLKELTKIAEEFGSSNLEFVLAPDGFDPIESGKTFIENAVIKARDAARLSGLTSVADDSGLCVDALNGRPGVHSARYAEGDDAIGRKKLLLELARVPADRRQAAFVCAMAVVQPDGQILLQVQKQWEGVIAFEESGSNGFGYDPIFVPEGMSVSSAELSPEAKNGISHRGQAWRAVLDDLVLNELAGSWIDDPEFDEAIRAQHDAVD